MPLIQFQFESSFEPPRVITEWWETYGMGQGLKLPDPLVEGDASTAGGYQDTLWINLELWGLPESNSTICRLSAESAPLGSANVLEILQQTAELLQPPPRQAPAEPALAADSFTWIGGWEWSTEDGSIPADWSLAKSAEVRARVPNGLCASDGSLIGDGTKNAKWGFVDARRRIVYLGFEYIPKDAGEIQLEIIDGTGTVPISEIPGVSVVRNANSAYSAALASEGDTIAKIDYHYGKGYVSLVNVADGQTRGLTWFDSASGGEDISFSPDDKWLLIPATRSGALIINSETGQHKSLSSLDHATCWWVQDGHLGLLSIGRGDFTGPEADPYTVTFHDLTTGLDTQVVRINPPNFETKYPALWHAEPNADGIVLVAMWTPDVLRVDAGNGFFNLARLNLHTGALTPVVDLFADPEHNVRRKQDKWKWNSPLDIPVTSPATTLEEGFTQVDMSDWPELDDEYGAILRVDFGSPLLTVSR